MVAFGYRGARVTALLLPETLRIASGSMMCAPGEGALASTLRPGFGREGRTSATALNEGPLTEGPRRHRLASPPPTCRCWKRAQRSPPLETIETIARALKVTPVDLLGDGQGDEARSLTWDLVRRFRGRRGGRMLDRERGSRALEGCGRTPARRPSGTSLPDVGNIDRTCTGAARHGTDRRSGQERPHRLKSARGHSPHNSRSIAKSGEVSSLQM